jgi:hypothetical protein
LVAEVVLAVALIQLARGEQAALEGFTAEGEVVAVAALRLATEETARLAQLLLFTKQQAQHEAHGFSLARHRLLILLF